MENQKNSKFKKTQKLECLKTCFKLNLSLTGIQLVNNNFQKLPVSYLISAIYISFITEIPLSKTLAKKKTSQPAFNWQHIKLQKTWKCKKKFHHKKCLFIEIKLELLNLARNTYMLASPRVMRKRKRFSIKDSIKSCCRWNVFQKLHNAFLAFMARLTFHYFKHAAMSILDDAYR